ncbi:MULTISPECIES: hypothetical protein [Bacillaceae]|uniref:hypothetical protein n=1 Tax=Bacillaceae TaxID=186817 RepID=UPI001053B532|nr:MULTISPECIES: hypothetical protein [Bacillaceae]MDT2047488.1 hypothetical protein [Priestia flexa]TDB55228.1 hypothetical protein EPL02_03230 [Bacillus sp. CBEL-1]USY56391.1 hypothetical protein NIZ91_06980 [Bacillus sp. 1780r2a1]
MFYKGMVVGVISGTVLGLILKWIEQLTSKKVYTLLLNVDFIPFIGDIKWSEWIEFCFHLVIAVVIGIVFMWIQNRFHYLSSGRMLIVAIFLTLPTIPLYFPLTALAIKDTPRIDDMLAFFYWTVGHILFALSLWICSFIYKSR